MITRFLPKKAKSWLRLILSQYIRPLELIKYEPYQKNSLSYIIHKAYSETESTCKLGLPVPPKDLWMGYGGMKDEYLSSGEADIGNMLEILNGSSYFFNDRNRILDFGCAAGRMIRWLTNIATTCEVWGADISAEHIFWCKQHLHPPFNFITSTTLPHLPFEDRYFDFIYSGSVFTHIDDLVDPWLSELRRILNTEGRVYITIHDNNTIDVLNRSRKDHALSKTLLSSKKYKEYIKSNFGMFTIGRHTYSEVFYDLDYFCQMVKPFFKVITTKREAYGYQTAVLLERR